jgi:hypothetical protein
MSSDKLALGRENAVVPGAPRVAIVYSITFTVRARGVASTVDLYQDLLTRNQRFFDGAPHGL